MSLRGCLEISISPHFRSTGRTHSAIDGARARNVAIVPCSCAERYKARQVSCGYHQRFSPPPNNKNSESDQYTHKSIFNHTAASLNNKTWAQPRRTSWCCTPTTGALVSHPVLFPSFPFYLVFFVFSSFAIDHAD